ncbi:MAG: hypothetical protein HUU37_06775 [Bdellovibrionales bacterium]|nr:hypothetical protein [Bdellovibrionales bacterium]
MNFPVTLSFNWRMLLALFLLLPHTEADAFGKKQEDEEDKPKAPEFIQAKPYRLVQLAHVTTPAFTFPNGVRADFNADLNKIIDSQINGSRWFRTVEVAATPSRLVVTGGITSLELDALQLNLKVGWNDNGVIPMPGVPWANGEVDFRLSKMSMDFKVYDRLTGQTYLASYTDENLSNLKIQVRLRASDITAAVDILYKTGIAEAVRRATADIMTSLENHAHFDYVPWEASVLSVDPEHGRLVFNAGLAGGVAARQVYSVYASCQPGGECRFLADAKVESAGAFQSEAGAFTANDSFQRVRAGDKVYVKPLAVSTGAP